MRHGKGVPPCGGPIVAAIIRSKDDSGVGELATKLLLNLYNVQLATSYSESLEVARNDGTGHEGPEYGETVYKRNESLHVENRGCHVGRTWDMQARLHCRSAARNALGPIITYVPSIPIYVGSKKGLQANDHTVCGTDLPAPAAY